MVTDTRVLIIDDDPDFVESTKAILESKDYEVRAAYNQDEGLAMLEEDVPDLIILDIMMRRFAEGLVLARKVREDSRFKEVRILVITSIREQTGFDFPGEPIHPQFFPVDDYVEKPIAPESLLDKVEGLLASASET